MRGSISELSPDNWKDSAFVGAVIAIILAGVLMVTLLGKISFKKGINDNTTSNSTAPQTFGESEREKNLKEERSEKERGNQTNTSEKWYRSLLDREVTHIEVMLTGSAGNWDDDNKDDGISFRMVPMSDDLTHLPEEGILRVRLYSLGESYERDELIYRHSFHIGKYEYKKLEILKEVYASDYIRIPWREIDSNPGMRRKGRMALRFRTEDGTFYKNVSIGRLPPVKPAN